MISRKWRKTVAMLPVAAIVAVPSLPQRGLADEKPPLIPRDVLFGNPEKANVQLSPDGKQISFLAPVNGVLNVWVGPADDPGAAKAVTNDTHRGIRNYFWPFTSKHILYLQDKGGNEDFHVYSVDLATKKTTDLTPFENVRAMVAQVSPDFPEEILIGLNNRNPQHHDIHRVNITTGKMSLVQENTEGFAGFVTERDMKVYFGQKMTPDGGSEIHKLTGDNSWTLLTKIPATDTLTTSALMLDESRKNLFMLESRGRNTAALTLMNIAHRRVQDHRRGSPCRRLRNHGPSDEEHCAGGAVHVYAAAQMADSRQVNRKRPESPRKGRGRRV